MAVPDPTKPALGDYTDPDPKKPLPKAISLDKSSPLYDGISDYEKVRAGKIEAYQQKKELPVDTKQSPTYFRDRFYELTIENQRLPIGGTYQPPKTMEELFKSDYVELYQLALEEEVNSIEYMNAVLNASTKYYEGEKWAERPIVFVGGPSASGKSFAADDAIQQASRFLKKDDGIVDNAVISVDGGIARDVSQVRKLALNTATNMGFSGIADLHAQSQILRQIKHRVYNHAMKESTAGVVIPDTFSAFIKPNSKALKMMQLAMKLPNSKTIFTKIEGANPSIFQTVVKFMGSSRAWATGEIKQKDIHNLNAKTVCESKAYGAGGFQLGVYGSKLAEYWFKLNSPNNLSMQIVNDLVLKKEILENGQYKLIDAKPEDKDAFKISKRVCDKWEKEPHPRESILTYMEKDENKVRSLINTSAEIKVEIAKVQIDKILKNKSAEMAPDAPLAISLNKILKILDSGKLDAAKIENLEKEIRIARIICKEKSSLALLTSNTFKQLGSLAIGVEGVKKELGKIPEPPVRPASLIDRTSKIIPRILSTRPASTRPESIRPGSTRPGSVQLATPASVKISIEDVNSAIGDTSLTSESAKFDALAKSVKYAATRYIDATGGNIKRMSMVNNSNTITIAKELRDEMQRLERDDKKDLEGLKETILHYTNQDDDEKFRGYIRAGIQSYLQRVDNKVENAAENAARTTSENKQHATENKDEKISATPSDSEDENSSVRKGP